MSGYNNQGAGNDNDVTDDKNKCNRNCKQSKITSINQTPNTKALTNKGSGQNDTSGENDNTKSGHGNRKEKLVDPPPPPKPTPDKTDAFLYRIRKPDIVLGYKSELLANALTEMEREFYLCPGCKGIIRDAHFTLKGTVCKRCTTDSIQYENTKIKEKIKKLASICPLHEDRNCDWKGTIGQVEDHITKCCDHVIIICSHGCPELPIGPRIELNNHMDNVCPKRTFRCEHCIAVCVAEEYEDHLKDCMRRPYECELKCGLGIPREEMATHITDICDNTHVVCPYKELGCEAEMLRKQLRGHIDEEYLFHISITLTTVRDLNARIQTLENK